MHHAKPLKGGRSIFTMTCYNIPLKLAISAHICQQLLRLSVPPRLLPKFIKKKPSTITKVSNHEASFKVLTEQMLKQTSHIWNSVEVFNTCVGLGGNHSWKSLITELQTHFGKDQIVMHVSGCASINGFRNHIPYNLQLVDDDQDDESVGNLVGKIKQETSDLPGISNYDIS